MWTHWKKQKTKTKAYTSAHHLPTVSNRRSLTQGTQKQWEWRKRNNPGYVKLSTLVYYYEPYHCFFSTSTWCYFSKLFSCTRGWQTILCSIELAYCLMFFTVCHLRMALDEKKRKDISRYGTILGNSNFSAHK